MNKIIYTYQVDKIIDHTKVIRELKLSLLQSTSHNSEFHFRAGQFVMLHVPSNEEKPILRAYSIASSDKNFKQLSLIFKYVDNGKASTYVWSLKGGEQLNFTGPFGRLFFKEPPTEQIIFLNTGSGLAQHYCYLESFKEIYPKLKCKMLIGLNDESELYFGNNLKQLTNYYKDFYYDFVLNKPTGIWSGKIGFVQYHLQEILTDKITSTFYLCGNRHMIKEAKEILVNDFKIESSFILSESFD